MPPPRPPIEAESDAAPRPPERLTIPEPNFKEMNLAIESTAPFVFNKFSTRQQRAMAEKQEAGQQGKNRTRREPKDFESIWKETLHISLDGWVGIPASSFRNALITACKTVGYKMTMAKLSIFIQADGYDKDDGSPLVRVTSEQPPRRFDAPVRIAMGSTDIATRGRLDQWTANVRVLFDLDQFRPIDILNLLSRAGLQVGVGAGRPDSRTSTGQGWGTFRVKGGLSGA
jgi:hypothetical protein